MRHIKISSLSEQKKFEEIGEIVEKGGVITYPTDTIYGFGCSPFCLDAVERIHEIKGRPDKSPF